MMPVNFVIECWELWAASHRGLGALEGLTWDSAQGQVTSGDQLSPGSPYCKVLPTAA